MVSNVQDILLRIRLLSSEVYCNIFFGHKFLADHAQAVYRISFVVCFTFWINLSTLVCGTQFVCRSCPYTGIVLHTMIKNEIGILVGVKRGFVKANQSAPGTLDQYYSHLRNTRTCICHLRRFRFLHDQKLMSSIGRIVPDLSFMHWSVELRFEIDDAFSYAQLVVLSVGFGSGAAASTRKHSYYLQPQWTPEDILK